MARAPVFQKSAAATLQLQYCYCFEQLSRQLQPDSRVSLKFLEPKLAVVCKTCGFNFRLALELERGSLFPKHGFEDVRPSIALVKERMN